MKTRRGVYGENNTFSDIVNFNFCSSSSSSNSHELKRRRISKRTLPIKTKRNSKRKEMLDCEFTDTFKDLLREVCQGERTNLGKPKTKVFWNKFTGLLSTKLNRNDITVEQVIQYGNDLKSLNSAAKKPELLSPDLRDTFEKIPPVTKRKISSMFNCSPPAFPMPNKSQRSSRSKTVTGGTSAGEVSSLDFMTEIREAVYNLVFPVQGEGLNIGDCNRVTTALQGEAGKVFLMQKDPAKRLEALKRLFPDMKTVSPVWHIDHVPESPQQQSNKGSDFGRVEQSP